MDKGKGPKPPPKALSGEESPHIALRVRHSGDHWQYVRAATLYKQYLDPLAISHLQPPCSADGSTTVTITNCAPVLGDAHLGDSISVNGTCLTITALMPATSSLTVSISPETQRRTTLGSLTEGQRVNLERAVSASTRMGGHFVQGHVDTVAAIVAVVPDGDCLTFRLRPRDRGVLKYVVEKGYVTLDGASLTVTKVQEDRRREEAGWFE
ncbi:MAG: hypothetical protein Q9163_002489, partial [Psora crenata]